MESTFLELVLLENLQHSHQRNHGTDQSSSVHYGCYCNDRSNSKNRGAKSIQRYDASSADAMNPMEWLRRVTAQGNVSYKDSNLVNTTMYYYLQ